MGFHDRGWSGAEKKIARRAFDAALDKRTAEIVAAFQAKVAAMATPSDMWALENYLRQQRRAVEELFDYRYSQLCFVFAQFIHLDLLNEGQLAGLGKEKLDIIHDERRRIRERQG